MNIFDVIVIGGGVVGASILRSLSGSRLSALLLEKSDDVSTGSSRANSGIVHAGYDAEEGTLKALFNVRGCKMYPKLCRELHVPYRQIGSLVVADDNGRDNLAKLEKRGIANGVTVSVIQKDELLALEPNLADRVTCALWAPEAGVVSPYKLTIAMADQAVINGAEVLLNKQVTAVSKTDGIFSVKCSDGSEYSSRVVINCAGAGAVAVNAMIGAETPEEKHAVGDYYVLDNTECGNVSRVVFPLPDENGKGILVSPTADGNVIYGPTSRSVPHKSAEENCVTLDGLQKVRDGISKTYKCANIRRVIRVYAGTRTTVGDDFIIKEAPGIDGFIMLLGICSPGLTSAPAIAEYVVDELVAKRLDVSEKKPLEPLPEVKKFAKMTPYELVEAMKEDNRYGRLICRCEKVSEAEIVNAIHSPVPALTVDAVKRRTRAGMGRCQGGFCAPRVMEIIARELKVPYASVKKGGAGSEIAVCEVKEGL